MPIPRFFLTTGDLNFADLCGGREINPGIVIPCESRGSLGATLLITGDAGTGKTTLACQLCAVSMKENSKVAKSLGVSTEFWPKNARAIIYSLDQRPKELQEIITRCGWASESETSILRWKQSKKPFPRDSDVASVDVLDEAALKSQILLKRVPPQTTFSQILAEIYNDVNNPDDEDSEENSDAAIKIVVIDAINQFLRCEDDYHQVWAELLQLASDGGDRRRRFSLILTLEQGESTPVIEEYRPQAVIHLGRGRDTQATRTIEIKKARNQGHLVGLHDFIIQSDSGVKVYPSIACRAKQSSPSPILLGGTTAEVINFGVRKIDENLRQMKMQFLKGSTSLLWGDPGTSKTDICKCFLAEESSSRTPGDLLLLTSKIDPLVFAESLDNLTRQRGAALRGIREMLKIIDARNPYKNHSMICTDVIDICHDSRVAGFPIARAVVFGLGLLEEAPATRDEQWRFVSVLVSILERQGISTLVVDWPIEQILSKNTGGGSPRPRVSKLCGNEIMMAQASTREGPPPPGFEDAEFVATITRSRYAALPTRSREVYLSRDDLC